MEPGLNLRSSGKEHDWYMCGDLGPVLEKADVALLELHDLVATGPRFEIIHRFRRAGTDCMAGEEVAEIALVGRTSRMILDLSLALRLLFDYLARNRHRPQSAAQIVAGMRTAPFYRQHAANAGSRHRQTRKISHSAIKVYVMPIRLALSKALLAGAIFCDGSAVLRSRPTVGNEVKYCLCGVVEWLHADDLSHESFHRPPARNLTDGNAVCTSAGGPVKAVMRWKCF